MQSNLHLNIVLDKIASVTKNANLPQEVTITEKIVAREGSLLVVKILEDKKIYNQVELASGRLSILKKGDIVAVALGNRRALKGFVGEVPKTLAVGDTINILNLGGVAGLCTSENLKEVGHSLKAKVLGAIAAKTLGAVATKTFGVVPMKSLGVVVTKTLDAVPAKTFGAIEMNACEHSLNIKQFTLFSPKMRLESTIPLIVVSGTCMNVGKTSVACEIIKHAHRKKYKVFAAKLAGVAALRDTENMKDYGAKEAVTFVDAGFTSTVNNGDKAVEISKGAIDYLANGQPHCIVIEFGDGVYGEYGVMKILKDKEIQKNIIAHVGCAHDPMGAAKLVEVCAEIGAPIDLISGPVTDNSVGVKFVKDNLHVPAFNALFYGEQLFDHLLSTCLKK
ncbi:hypothetical protein HYV57_00315 [Candidatus Peregrinibacteria bacterium]|nr:hypothetical protein [Candidatus Peregrinibacteria bacterium]